MPDEIENGMISNDEDYEAASQEDYDWYWQDDMRKEAQIQADLQELNKKL